MCECHNPSGEAVEGARAARQFIGGSYVSGLI